MSEIAVKPTTKAKYQKVRKAMNDTSINDSIDKAKELQAAVRNKVLDFINDEMKLRESVTEEEYEAMISAVIIGGISALATYSGSAMARQHHKLTPAQVMRMARDVMSWFAQTFANVYHDACHTRDEKDNLRVQ